MFRVTSGTVSDRYGVSDPQSIAGQITELASTLAVADEHTVLGISTFFLHFGEKTLFYAWNDDMLFCLSAIGNKGFRGS